MPFSVNVFAIMLNTEIPIHLGNVDELDERFHPLNSFPFLLSRIDKVQILCKSHRLLQLPV